MYFTSTRLLRTRCLVLLFVIFSTAAYTQVIQSDRFEITLDRNEKHFEITPAEDRGLFLHRRFRSEGNEDQVQIIKLDTAFQVNWQGYLPINRKFAIMGKRAEKDHLYLLLRNQDYTKKDLELISVEQQKGTFLRYVIRNFIAFVPTEFQITDQAALIGGYFNHVPVVIHFAFDTQKTKVLPGLLNESGELTQIQTYPDGAFDVLISAKNFGGERTIWIKNYDPEGNILRNVPLQPEHNKHLIFARSIKTANDMQLVAGVYGARNSEYSKGIFIASVDPSGLQQLRYYDYGDLENFFKYMKAKREQRVKERIERRKIRGKKTRFNYRFLVHEITPYNNQFILLGEAFYPRYQSVERTYYNGFFTPYNLGPNYIRNGRVFDGYRYTHAVVMGFDPNGKLLWDNSFEINDVKTYTLEQFVKLEKQPDKIALLYLFENQLRSKIIKGNEVLEGKTFEPLKTNSEKDIAKFEQSGDSNLDYWYDDYFYAHGTQEISNADHGRRRVFFINKVSYAK
jgi:hypothetical protein